VTKRALLVRVFFATAATSAIACGTVIANEPANADAGTIDAGFEARGDSSEVLRENFDKEVSPGCGFGWRGQGSTIDISDAGRDGGRACRVCGIEGGTYLGVASGPLVVDAVPGITYFFETWVRDETPNPEGGTSVYALFFIERPNAQPAKIEQDAEIRADGTWVPIQVTMKSEARTTISVAVTAKPASETDCIYVDDVIVTKK